MNEIVEPNYEYVILVDENNNELGTARKSEVHQKETPLHRAFSCFIFNKDKQLLLQQRAKSKKTWPLVWSNSVCGHPKLNESNENTVIRRSDDELGCKVKNIKEISDYRYKFSRYGVQENEICPILVAQIDSDLNLNKDEVEEIKWISWKDWLVEVEKEIETLTDVPSDKGLGISNSLKYSEWCREETKILQNNKEFQNWFKQI